jgi:hypothetical protein
MITYILNFVIGLFHLLAWPIMFFCGISIFGHRSEFRSQDGRGFLKVIVVVIGLLASYCVIDDNLVHPNYTGQAWEDIVERLVHD